MSKRKIFDFLRDLRDNNSKEWMDANRSRYHEAKEIWLAEIKMILTRLAQYDPYFTQVKPKDTIPRINNNRRFHPDKPIYKDFFGCMPNHKRTGPTFYIAVSPTESFIGGGYWKPEKETVEKLREAFDYDGDQFKKIIQAPAFVDFFGGLGEDPDKLKTSPQNWSIEHKHIDLLRHKNFVARRNLTQKEVLSDGFIDLVEEAFRVIQPFNAYLAKAASVEL